MGNLTGLRQSETSVSSPGIPSSRNCRSNGESVPAAAAKTADSLSEGWHPTEVDVQASLMRTLVSFSDTLTEDFRVETTIELLIQACLRLVEDAEISVILADDAGGLRVAGTSSERKRVLEAYQIKQGEGPSIEAYRSGEECQHERVDASDFPWSEVSALAKSFGYKIIRSIPLRRRDDTIGVLSIAQTMDVPRPPQQGAFLRALADTTTIGFLNQRAFSASNKLSQQLQTALTTRVLIEQSKGAIAARLGLTVDEAFEMLRSYARGTNRKLNEVSGAVLDGSLATHELWTARKPSAKRSA